MHILLVGMYVAGVRIWAKAPEGFSARSTVRASELHSPQGACDACSGAHPSQKEKALMAYERISGHRSILRMVGYQWTQ